MWAPIFVENRTLWKTKNWNKISRNFISWIIHVLFLVRRIFHDFNRTAVEVTSSLLTVYLPIFHCFLINQLFLCFPSLLLCLDLPLSLSLIIFANIASSNKLQYRVKFALIFQHGNFCAHFISYPLMLKLICHKIHFYILLLFLLMAIKCSFWSM